MSDNPEYDNEERLRRWRMVLGVGTSHEIDKHDSHIDNLLRQLYGKGMNRQANKKGKKAKRGGMEASMPNISQWLGDIRLYFPDTVVQVMQQDAIEKIGLKKLLTQKEILEQIQPDVQLVATLLSLKDAIPDETKITARELVRKLVEDLMKRLDNPLRQAIQGALHRAQRKFRPRHNEIDWNRTIRANLKHYQKEHESIIPHLLIGFGRRKRQNQRHVIIAVDQSGSMASSMVYSSIFAAIMASITALKTQMIVFDTSVVDMSDYLHDPVDLLFGTALGGGTDICQALAYCQKLVERPDDTIIIFISDLIEGNSREKMLQRAGQIIQSGVQFVSLLALTDRGTPAYDTEMAAELAILGAPAFACTPDMFPELMAAVMNRKDIGQWLAKTELKQAKKK